MRALLLIDVIFVVMAAPSSAWQKICGEQLVETVSLVCSTRGFYSHRDSKRDAEIFQDERAAKSFLGSHIASRQRRRTGRIATECCERICSYDIVESYCNPWPVVEARDAILAPVAPGRVREDKSADVDYLYPETANAEEVNSVIRREEALIEAMETQQHNGDENVMQIQSEDEAEKDVQEEDEAYYPVPVPTKKRRRVDGRKSRENSRNKSGKSEGRSKKRSGSREGGKSSRRRGKSSRSKKQQDVRERSKRWEGIVTSHVVPSKEKEEDSRKVFRGVDSSPFRNFLYNRLTVDEKRDTEKERHYPRNISSQAGFFNKYRVSQRDDDPTLAALYHLAVRLAKGLGN